MSTQPRRFRPSAELVLAFVALFVSITGTASALKGKNTVFSNDIKNGQVKTKDVAMGAVGSDALLGKPLPQPRSLTRQSGLEQSKAISSSGAISSLFDNDTSFSSQSLAKNGIDTSSGDQNAFDSSVATQSKITKSGVGTGQLSQGTPVGAVTRTVGTPISFAQETKIPFNQETIDQGAMVSGNGTELCAPTNGVYRIIVTVVWEQNEFGVRGLFLRRDNGEVLAYDTENGSVNGVVAQTLATSQALKTDECVSAVVLHTAFKAGQGPFTLDILSQSGSQGNSPYFSATFVAPANRNPGF